MVVGASISYHDSFTLLYIVDFAGMPQRRRGSPDPSQQPAPLNTPSVTDPLASGWVTAVILGMRIAVVSC